MLDCSEHLPSETPHNSHKVSATRETIRSSERAGAPERETIRSSERAGAPELETIRSSERAGAPELSENRSSELGLYHQSNRC
jgi:hypothetical protein